MVFLGDSNLARFPLYPAQDLQIDSFPGASLHHAESLLRNAVCATDITVLLLSFGLNNRQHKPQATSIRQLQRTLRVANFRFPEATVLVPLINFSPLLPLQERRNLQVLNDHIKKHCNYIPQLPAADFKTEPDKIHWTRETAAKMLAHWKEQVNC